MELGLKLDKSVYKLGDTIDIHAECTVEGGFTDVKKVRKTNISGQKFIYSVIYSVITSLSQK